MRNKQEKIFNEWKKNEMTLLQEQYENALKQVGLANHEAEKEVK